MDSESFHLQLAKVRSKGCACISARYALTALIFWGLFMVYVLRANLSIALVAMVNNTAVATSEIHYNNSRICAATMNTPVDNSTDAKKYNFEKDGDLTWDINVQARVLGAFYYGYSATQLPGGWISERWGGKWPFGLGIILTSIFTILTPIAAQTGEVLAIITRVAKGLGEGITFPAMYALFSRWAPEKERSFLIAVATVGSNLGTIVGMPATALFCEHGGWQYAFYVCGVLGCLWFIPWAICVSSRPTKHSTISDLELIYLKLNLQPLKKRQPTPWKAIFCSGPVWAVTLARFASYWGLFTLITELPNYLRNVMSYSIDENGTINAIIYLSQSVGMVVGGYLSDVLRRKSSIPINMNRKIFESIGCFGPAVCLLCVTFSGCNRYLVIGLLALGQMLYGFNAGGSVPAMVDMAPDLTGTVSGFVLSTASVAGVFAPMVAGTLVYNAPGLDGWNHVFYVSSGVYFIGGFAFLFFGSAKVQPWGHYVEVPTEKTEIKSPLFVTLPSASFSGRSRSMTDLDKLNKRHRFSTVSFSAQRKISIDFDTSLEPNE